MGEKGKYLPSKVFAPKSKPNLSNQKNYRLNYLNEFISQQLKQNENIQQSFLSVSESVHSTHLAQKARIEQVISDQQQHKYQTELFNEKVKNQSKISEEILHTVYQLNDNQAQLNTSIENEKLINQAILDQLNFQDNQLRQTNDQLVYYATLSGQLSEQLIVQGQLLKEMEEKLQLQDIYHQTVMSKLDTQEALNEKIIRQIEQLKMAIHERMNNIIEKMESSFMSTTKYFTNLINKSGFTKPFLLPGRTKDVRETIEEKSEANKEN
jgi:hypothetical protein